MHRGLWLLPFIIIAVCMTILPAKAGELVYQPVNPSFGGSAFNQDYLIGTANAQNRFKNARATSPTSASDPLADFSRTITNRLIASVANEIADRILGENPEDSGQFTIGDTSIRFVRNGEVVSIDIADAVTGGSTTITLPVPRL